MKTGLVAAAALAAGLSACAEGEFRYTPLEPAVPLSPLRMTKISSLGFQDSSGGLSEGRTSVELTRPFFDIFREGVERRLRALKVRADDPSGTLVDVQLTKAELRAAPGSPDVTATVEYSLVVRGGLDAVCRQDVSEWSTSSLVQAEKPAADALSKALAKAVDRLGQAISDSCLYAASSGSGSGAAAVDPEALLRVRPAANP